MKTDNQKDFSDQSSLGKKQIWPQIIQEQVFLILIFFFLVLNSWLLFFSPINQDEFFNLALIYKFVKGENLNQFQTFHVHLFSWITRIGENEIDQITFLRVIMLLFFCGSCFFLYLIGRKILDRPAALFSVFCFLTFAFVSFHGASFRTDTMVLFCFLVSIYILVWEISLINSVIAGILMAASLMLTIKSSVHFVTLIFILINQYYKVKERSKISLVYFFLVVFSLSYLSFFLFHQESLTVDAAQIDIVSPTENLSGKSNTATSFKAVLFLWGTFKRVFSMDNLFPEFRFLPGVISLNYLVWLFFIYGFFSVLLNKVYLKDIKRTGRCLLCFCIPLISLCFYKNAYPYYYVFIMAPCVVLCGVAIQQINDVFKKRIKPLMAVSLGLMIFFIFFQGFTICFARMQEKTYYTQQAFLTNLHRLFPRPVKYIDGSSMISSFQKVGPFMGTSWVKSYLKKGIPIFEDIIMDHQPKFIIANIPQLDFEHQLYSDNYEPLLARDLLILKNNYIPHWGLIYIAGKKIEFSFKGQIKEFRIFIPGKYTIKGNGEIAIDGENYNSGDVLILKPGNHFIKSLTALNTLYLRWGADLPDLKELPKVQPLFQGQLL